MNNEVIEPKLDQFLGPPYVGPGEICIINGGTFSTKTPALSGNGRAMGVWFVGANTESKWIQPLATFLLN